MVKRVVDAKFWTDMQVMDHYSVEDKYFALYLLTNGRSTQVGIYSLPKKVMSFETGFTKEVIEILLDRFSNTYGKIVYSEQTQEITWLNSLEFSILRGGKPVQDLLEKEIAQVKDVNLIEATYQAMLPHWTMSTKVFDQTIQEIFEAELTKRGSMQNQNQNQNQKHSHNKNQSHNHNQESYATNRGTIRETETDDDEKATMDRYVIHYKEKFSNHEGEITPENLVQVYYENLIGEVHPHIKTQLKSWCKALPNSLVLEALKRSLHANQPILYAATVIENWKKAGVQTARDVENLDLEHNQESVK